MNRLRMTAATLGLISLYFMPPCEPMTSTRRLVSRLMGHCRSRIPS
jgi:hypothetical protein